MSKTGQPRTPKIERKFRGSGFGATATCPTMDLMSGTLRFARPTSHYFNQSLWLP